MKESVNLHSLARNLRDKKGQLTEMCTTKENKAERALKKVNDAQEEIIRSQAVVSSYEGNQKRK